MSFVEVVEPPSHSTSSPMAQPAFKPVVRSTVVDAVTEQLRTEILSGTFPPGKRLPAERELASQLGVNRLTLRAALGRLETLGLIEIQHGTGSRVRDYRQHGGIETLPNLVRLARESDPENYLALARDVLELRRTIAAEAVALAAERHTAEDLEAMRAAARAQAARVGDVLAFARGDIEFARALVRATHNLGLELLLNTMARFPEADAGLARAMYPSPRAQYEHYDVVLGLIESRAPAAIAREAMRGALEAIDNVTLTRLRRDAGTQRSVRRRPPLTSRTGKP